MYKQLHEPTQGMHRFSYCAHFPDKISNGKNIPLKAQVLQKARKISAFSRGSMGIIFARISGQVRFGQVGLKIWCPNETRGNKRFRFSEFFDRLLAICCSCFVGSRAFNNSCIFWFLICFYIVPLGGNRCEVSQTETTSCYRTS